MTFEQLVDYYGSQAEAARQIGIKPPSISEWRVSGIPELRQIQIEKLTRGRLKAEQKKAA